MPITNNSERTCPGCGLIMPRRDAAPYGGYFNASPECWSVFTEVLAREYSNAVLFGQVHQLTVDGYAVQHAGGPHPDKSMFIHLSGLHLVLERGFRPTTVPPLLQQLASRMDAWPHYEPPRHIGGLTVCDIALADSPEDHRKLVRDWAGQVWQAWSPYHSQIASVLSEHLGLLVQSADLHAGQ